MENSSQSESVNSSESDGTKYADFVRTATNIVFEGIQRAGDHIDNKYFRYKKRIEKKWRKMLEFEQQLLLKEQSLELRQ